MGAATVGTRKVQGGGSLQQAVPAQGRSRLRLGRIRAPISKTLYGGLAVAGFLLPLAIWEAISAWHLVGRLFLPSPADVWGSLAHWYAGGLLRDTGISVYRVVAGFVLACLIGVPLGLFIGAYKWCEALLQPINDFVRYMPASAFIPLVILWVGIGEGSKIAIIFIGVVFQIVVMVADAVRKLPDRYLEAAYTMGAREGEVMKLVVWRGTWPQIVDILRINMGWAWTYLVVAEMVAADSGLGFAILQAQRFLDTAKIFVGIIIIGLIGLAFDLLFRALHKQMFPWYRP
ncbi:ABC transporter permease [Acidiferrobacter sp.]|uniref:ABC transporter permease n=1 Tax=Acidiferrobacter sp. TaxID=1872107 RepID=UPI002629A374|nr:ABC transporter permease [Acidiferrobacter sp.]